MAKLYLALGTNLGDKFSNIHEVLSRLDEALGSHYEALSSVYRTHAEGFEGPDFLNSAVRYECSLDPFKVLAVCKKVEAEMGRVQNVEFGKAGERIYHSRPIDIDIILYGDMEVKTDYLTIPHPRMKERGFVMDPLKEILV